MVTARANEELTDGAREAPPAAPSPAPPPIAERRPRKGLVLVVLVVAGLAFAGLVLSGNATFKLTVWTNMLDTDELKTRLTQGISDLGAPVDGVTCPERELRQGDIFECSARVDGQDLLIEVVQRDGEGNVDLRQLQALLQVSTLESVGANLLGRDLGTAVRLDCGTAEWLVREPGDTVECDGVTANGDRGPVVVTVQDEEGNVRFDT